jgi:hypothetical protein
MIRVVTVFLAIPVCAAPALGQTHGSTAIRDEVMGHFESSITKIISLADAMPAESYSWKPSADAMPVGQVFAHIARYNFLYPASSMAIPAPAAIKHQGADRGTPHPIRRTRPPLARSHVVR